MLRRLLLLALLATGCAKSVPPTMMPDDVVEVTTEDGWVLPLRHYPGPGEPVLLVHGMGANHYNWDYREEVSLAAWLQEQGWDVWVPELRGDPGSTAPSRRAPKEFSFDDHAVHDLPAILDGVRAATGAETVHWVGHSMGGMLLYTALATYPEKIESGVAVCSPAEFEALLGIHKNVRGMGWAFGGRGRVPARALARLTAGLGKANPLYKRLGNRDNFDFPVANGMATRALIDLPRPMVKQVTTWLKSGALLTDDGEPWLADVDTRVPVLVMGGAVDRIVPEPNVAAACALFEDCTYVLLGTEGGLSTDYGHVDPIVGKTARDEIYPLIGAFLADHAGAAVAGTP